MQVTQVTQITWCKSRRCTWQRTRSMRTVMQDIWWESRSMKYITWHKSRRVDLWPRSYEVSHASWSECELTLWQDRLYTFNPGRITWQDKENMIKKKRKSNTTQKKTERGVSYPFLRMPFLHLSARTKRLWVKSRCILNDWLLRYKHQPTYTYNMAPGTVVRLRNHILDVSKGPHTARPP